MTSVVSDIVSVRKAKVRRAALSSALLFALLGAIELGVFFFQSPRPTSAASGQVIVMWDGASVPSGWTCISCATSDPFYGAFPMGSSTYANATSGSDTAAPTASFLSEATGTSVTISRTGSSFSAAGHTHAISGSISVAASDIRPPYQDLELIEAATTTLPNGTIGIFDVPSSSLPANWSYYSAMAGRYLRTASDTLTGGSATSTNLLTATTAAETSTAVGAAQGGGTQVAVANSGHTHAISGNIQPASDTPPYVTVVFGKLTTTSTIPTGFIGMFDASPPAGWANVSNSTGTFNGRFLLGGDTYGATGGFATVVHPTTTLVSGLASATSSARSGTTQVVSDGAHTHAFTFTFGAESIVPVNRQVIFAKREPSVTVGSSGTQIASTTFPASGFFVGGAFTFVRDQATATVSQILITASGTVSATSSLSNLVLYYKTAAICATSSLPGGATQFNAAGVSFNGSSTATATGTMAVGISQVCVYAKVDIGSGASAGQTFQLTITNPSANVTVDTGNVAPASVVGLGGQTTLQTPTITVGTTGTQVATATIPKSALYIGGAFTFVRNGASTTVSQITVTENGTVNANANLSNLKLFYETASTCATSTIPGGVSTFNATGGTFNASEQSTVTGSMAVATSQVCMYLQVDVGSGANGSDTINFSIANPSADVVTGSGSVAPATAVALSGTTTLETPSSFIVEQDFHVYDNVDAVQPVTPLAAEDASATDIAQNAVIRLRLNLISENGPLPTSSQAFKLQYALRDGFVACTNVPSGNFADVGAFASSTIWRGFNNTSTADGSTITSLLLSTSTVAESYVEENPSPANPNRIPTNGVGEWDFVVENNGATNNAAYCFRAVKSDGTALAQYNNLPEVKVVRPLFEVHYRWRNDNGGE